MVNEMRSTGKKIKLIYSGGDSLEMIMNRGHEKHYSDDRGVHACCSEVICTHYLRFNYIPML